MDDIQSSVTSALVSTTRAASQLANEDLTFHRSLDASLSSALDRQDARLLALSDRLLGAATANTETVRPPSLKNIEDVESNWRAVVDVVDSLLERADTALDEFTGAVRRLSPAADVPRSPKPSKIAPALKHADLEKPQLSFHHPPKNDETGPFVPLLSGRPHAFYNANGDTDPHAHPYQAEIETYTYPPSVYTQSEPIMYHPFESTKAVFVDTEEALEEMLEELQDAREIAIDLEHHDQRSYIGIVCLMQISSRNKDWIVDTLKPWRRKLSCLNEVLANPDIVKVLHGAYMDVVWLQRDLGLYLVGLFDTHYAARALGYTGGSLAFLLKKFADVDAQKQYQMADWRIRPLPQELFDYARSDTHYLLYIFDNMRNELIQRSDFGKPNNEGDKIHDVLVKSCETALQRYEHPVYDAELGQGTMGWYKMLSRTSVLLTKEQFSVFRAIHRWRDDVAREQDDSVHFVMPNHQVFSIAKAMPTKRKELLNTAQNPTQTTRLRVDELLSAIVKAKEMGKNGPEMMDVLSKIEPQFTRKPAKEEVSHSVAAFVPQAQVSSSTLTNTSTNPALSLRSATSAFWGSVFSNRAPQSRNISNVADVSLNVPLPPLSADILTTSAEVIATSQESPASPQAVHHQPVPPLSEPEDENDIFVLKQLGKKRRRTDGATQPTDGSQNETFTDSAIEGRRLYIGNLAYSTTEVEVKEFFQDYLLESTSIPTNPHAARPVGYAFVDMSTPSEATRAINELNGKTILDRKVSVQLAKKPERATVEGGIAAQSDEVAIPDEEVERLQQKAGRKKAKKEADRAAKRAATENGVPVEEDEPFDYEAAPSILNPPRESREVMRDRKKKELNPYAKALDAPKGLPRAQKEKAGRTMTYKP